jgi:hypothetical protein
VVTILSYVCVEFLFLGFVNPGSNWTRVLSVDHPLYAIARLDVKGLLEDYKMVDQRDHFKINSSTNITTTPATDQTDIKRRKLLRLRKLNSLSSPIRLHSHRRHVVSPTSRRRLSKSNDNSSNNNNNVSNVPAATPIPWVMGWEWLPEFPGTNGPILKLAPGKKEYEGALYIGGAFDNLPSLLLWNAFPRKFGYGNLTAVGGRHYLDGLVTSMAEITFLDDSDPSPASFPTTSSSILMKYDFTLVILLLCVGLGVCMGLCFTMSCYSRPPHYPSDIDGENDENNLENVKPPSISLTTLSDGAGNAVDFKECFERAMKFRHLPTYETLIIINPKEILLSKIIGEGSFGRVWSGQWRNNSVAVKEFVFAQAAIAGGSLQRNNIIEEIVGEAGVMACLRHPKILQLYGCSLTMQAIWIVSELCMRGSLKMLLTDAKQDLPILKRLSIALDIADGMEYLHNRNPPIIHRDLKSHNIFISEPTPGQFVAKIGDWGSARAVQLTGSKSMTQGVGTACWLSPEVINNAHFSKSSDVYAFGIILWEIFTRQEIYEGLSAAQIIAKVAHEGLRPSIPRHCPWSKIMTQCWRHDAMERPDFSTICSHLSTVNEKYSRKLKEKQQQLLQQQKEKGEGGGTDDNSTSPKEIPSSSASNTNMDRDKYSGYSSSGGSEDYLLKYFSMNSRDDGNGRHSRSSSVDFPPYTTSNTPNKALPVTPPHTLHPIKITPHSSSGRPPSYQYNKPSAITPPSKKPRFYDTFHPSLENNNEGGGNPHQHSSINKVLLKSFDLTDSLDSLNQSSALYQLNPLLQNRVIPDEGVAHLPPEQLARLSSHNLLGELNIDKANNKRVHSDGSERSGTHVKEGTHLPVVQFAISDSGSNDEEQDPMSFLFNKKREKR